MNKDFVNTDDTKSIRISNDTELFSSDKVKVNVDKILVNGNYLKLEIKVQSEEGKLNNIEWGIDVGVVLNEIINTCATRIENIDENTQVTVIKLLSKEKFDTESIINLRIQGYRYRICEKLKLKINFDEIEKGSIKRSILYDENDNILGSIKVAGSEGIMILNNIEPEYGMCLGLKIDNKTCKIRDAIEDGKKGYCLFDDILINEINKSKNIFLVMKKNNKEIKVNIK